jgi:ABC-2 type transport system ATP-binding protein
MEEANRLCNRLAILADGKVVIEGTPAELRASMGSSENESTLHDVFMRYTGRSLDDDVAEEEDEDE